MNHLQHVEKKKRQFNPRSTLDILFFLPHTHVSTVLLTLFFVLLSFLSTLMSICSYLYTYHALKFIWFTWKCYSAHFLSSQLSDLFRFNIFTLLQMFSRVYDKTTAVERPRITVQRSWWKFIFIPLCPVLILSPCNWQDPLYTVLIVIKLRIK